MSAAKVVADKLVDNLAENTGTKEGMDANFNTLNPYYVMFCDTDMDKYPETKPYYEMGITGTDGDWAVGHYFHHDFFILFNLAVGGNFPGIHNPAQVTAIPENGSAAMYVDFVKVYQKK